MRRHGAVEGLGGEVFQRLGLVAGDAGGAENFIGCVEKRLGRRIAAVVLAHAAMDGGRRLAVQLLVEDRLEQRFEGRRQGIEAQGEGARAVDERAQLGIAGAKVGESLVGIERKLAAAAVVEHGMESTTSDQDPRWRGSDGTLRSGLEGCAMQWMKRREFVKAVSGGRDGFAGEYTAFVVGGCGPAGCAEAACGAKAGPGRQARAGDVQVPLRCGVHRYPGQRGASATFTEYFPRAIEDCRTKPTPGASGATCGPPARGCCTSTWSRLRPRIARPWSRPSRAAISPGMRCRLHGRRR